jgi:hypothetical protein
MINYLYKLPLFCVKNFDFFANKLPEIFQNL